MNRTRTMDEVRNSDYVPQHGKLFLKGKGHLFPLIRVNDFIGSDISDIEAFKSTVMHLVVRKDDYGFTGVIPTRPYAEYYDIMGGELDAEWNLDVIQQSLLRCRVLIFEDGESLKKIQDLGLEIGIDLQPCVLSGEELLAYEMTKE